MKVIITTALALLALAAASVAIAAPAANPCARGGWASAQTANGLAFASMRECQKASDVYTPALSISPAHVVANERYTLTATGFHMNDNVTVYFAITGEAPYASLQMAMLTAPDGSWSVPFVFAECRKTETGEDVHVDLTLTLVDSWGLHASARLSLC